MGLSVLPPCTPYTVSKTPFLAVTRKAPSKTDTLLSCFRKKKGFGYGRQVGWPGLLERGQQPGRRFAGTELQARANGVATHLLM